MVIYYYASGNTFEAVVKDHKTKAAITDATVVMTLKDSAGASVPGETWPKAMVHIGSGSYTCIPAVAINLAEKHTYRAEVTVTRAGVPRFLRADVYCKADDD